MSGFAGLDLAVLLAYLVGVTAWGAWLGRGQRGGRDYFLGNRDLTSVVATETSTLTFLSIPGVAYVGTMGFLQLALGYIVGRVAVAAVLLPAYYRGELATAYAMLEGAFGSGTRRLASGIFMVTRFLADSVRLFATAIPLALITGWPYPASIAVIGALTLVYTYAGGIRAVVWVDPVQLGLYGLGGVAAAALLEGLVPGGWSAILAEAGRAGKLAVVDPGLDLSEPYTLWAGLLGGAFLSMASHGADQLIVQRLLTCRDLARSRRALVGSGFAVAVQFALFLGVGVGLWALYGGGTVARPDEVFARFIVEEMPVGLRGLLIAGVFAAAMSSLSSSINSLASASTYDFWLPRRGGERLPAESRSSGRPDAPGESGRSRDARALRVGRAFTLGWALLLVAGAIAFIPLSRERAAVEVALGVASLVYGGLLGAFVLAILAPSTPARAVEGAVVAGIGAVAALWFAQTFLLSRPVLAWPWYVLLGTLLTVGTGRLVATLPRFRGSG